ncbi:MAG: NIPSNAP family protein [Alphaproteobacteria bacterium]|nr:NIPSNAP family protein [Alphaproteobacteria bacterium]MBL6938715.1 NIPSNAP family protein [Alphaproteobacteria bacterium]MBL7097928.1 NIPSNAP family protein [Alphaproteobacteria bacterium]
MKVTCCIRYTLDPYKREAFEDYARQWLSIIPACGGELHGYWMPHEGTDNIALAMISFDSLASYEKYRARIKADERGMANFRFAQTGRFILSEERTFLRMVEP